MKVNTRLFGEIEVAEDRIITFTQGLMGFEEYTRYTLIYNSEKKGRIMWLQCLDEPQLAFTVSMQPSGPARQSCPPHDPAAPDDAK